jgi:hypothetical protein
MDNEKRTMRILHCPLSIIHYPLSIIRFPLSIIRYQLFSGSLKDAASNNSEKRSVLSRGPL